MIRLGVVGYGCRIHRLISGVFRQLEPDLKVVGIVDPDEVGVRRRLAASDGQDAIFYKDLDALVRQGKPDALAVGTRCNLHTPYAIKAASYDLPLYLEKPVAINMRQAVATKTAQAHWWNSPPVPTAATRNWRKISWGSSAAQLNPALLLRRAFKVPTPAWRQRSRRRKAALSKCDRSIFKRSDSTCLQLAPSSW
ncbi:MAG: hypothetical protein CME16_03330 [Gemmatimonadetes bacterium]|nr:hypothetical protein [Gemmatimonadota bacterium]